MDETIVSFFRPALFLFLGVEGDDSDPVLDFLGVKGAAAGPAPEEEADLVAVGVVVVVVGEEEGEEGPGPFGSSVDMLEPASLPSWLSSRSERTANGLAVGPTDGGLSGLGLARTRKSWAPPLLEREGGAADCAEAGGSNVGGSGAGEASGGEFGAGGSTVGGATSGGSDAGGS